MAIRSFDVAVIGAGPAGLSAAAELTTRGATVVVLDQGPATALRDRSSPDELLAGIGGAGLFSDGKFSFAPAASGLWVLPGIDGAIDRVVKQLEAHGVIAPHDPSALPAMSGEWMVKSYPSMYLGLAGRLAMIEAMRAAAGTVESGKKVMSVARDGDGFTIAIERSESVACKQLVVATGRWSARWIRPWLESLGASYKFTHLEFGVRLESDATHPMFAKLPGIDGKLRFVDDTAHSELRTFATCREGEVVVGHADGIRAFSGRADCPATGRSNVGLLVRSFHPALAREVLRFVDRASPTSLPLATWLARPTLLDPVFGTAGTLAIFHATRRFATWAPELDRAVIVHAPAVEAIGEYPILDDNLAAAPGVYIAGDTGGRFRGLVAAMVSGSHVAARIA